MTRAPTLTCVITNDRHHVAMLEPVARALEPVGARVRVLSLCELRGFPSPPPGSWGKHVEIVRVLPFAPRGSPAAGAGGGSGKGARGVARTIAWRWLAGRIRRGVGVDTDVVLLPNDAAFPYDRIADLLRGGPPFVLVQEGIRFPTPCVENRVYGAGGAAAVAAWGEGSAAYFRSVGVEPDRIRLTGTPRFDGLRDRDWEGPGRELRERLGVGTRNLLLLSNPIDDLGFCSTGEKLALLGGFASELGPLFSDPRFHLTIKLHARESESATRAVVAGLPFAERITVVRDAPLYPLFAISEAAVVLASTTGLEALLFDLPLGILELPRAGYVHDYVARGAATGLVLDGTLAKQVESMIRPNSERRAAMRAYVRHHLAVVDGSAERVRDVVQEAGLGRPVRRGPTVGSQT